MPFSNQVPETWDRISVKGIDLVPETSDCSIMIAD